MPIDKAFAFSRYNDDEYISKEQFMEAFSCCERIYQSAREKALFILKKEEPIKALKSAKILEIDFTKFRR